MLWVRDGTYSELLQQNIHLNIQNRHLNICVLRSKEQFSSALKSPVIQRWCFYHSLNNASISHFMYGGWTRMTETVTLYIARNHVKLSTELLHSPQRPKYVLFCSDFCVLQLSVIFIFSCGANLRATMSKKKESNSVTRVSNNHKFIYFFK